MSKPRHKLSDLVQEETSKPKEQVEITDSQTTKPARANASKLLLIRTKVKNQRKNQHLSFDLLSKTQCDR